MMYKRSNDKDTLVMFGNIFSQHYLFIRKN